MDITLATLWTAVKMGSLYEVTVKHLFAKKYNTNHTDVAQAMVLKLYFKQNILYPEVCLRIM